MKAPKIALVLLFILSLNSAFAIPNEGFFLPDSIKEITFRYKDVNNLIVLPVRINDSIVVNLVLDTGCRNLVLFGKRFKKMFGDRQERSVQFSGLGKGKPAIGFVTLGNEVSFDAVTGKRIAIVVVPERNVFRENPEIDGVIGYELFIKFEIEINFSKHQITFRPARFSYPDSDFKLIPLRIEDSRPIISCTIVFSNDDREVCDLLIDTGSCLGLLFTTRSEKKSNNRHATVIGRGINGIVEGRERLAEELQLGDFTLTQLSTAIVTSPNHQYASLGTAVLKDYTVLLNYHRAYAGIKTNRGNRH